MTLANRRPSFRLLILGAIWILGQLSAATAVSPSAASRALLHGRRGLLGKGLRGTDTQTRRSPPPSQGRSRPRPSSSRRSLPPPHQKRAAEGAEVRSIQPPPPAPTPLAVPGTSSSGVSVCTYLAILMPHNPDTVPKHPFSGQIDCDVYTSLIASAWSVAAAARGVRITTPFTATACTPGSTVPRVLPSIQVCGAIATADEAALLQDDLEGLVAYLSTYMIFGQVPESSPAQLPAASDAFVGCPPPGYRFASWVLSEGGELAFSSEIACSEPRVFPA